MRSAGSPISGLSVHILAEPASHARPASKLRASVSSVSLRRSCSPAPRSPAANSWTVHVQEHELDSELPGEPGRDAKSGSPRAIDRAFPRGGVAKTASGSTRV